MKRQCESLGMPPPGGERPELWPGLEVYLEAFSALTTCRQLSTSEGPIPWTAVEQYGDAMEMDRGARGALHYLIREMDREYIEVRSRQMEAERKRRQSNNGAGQRK